jgi:uncharacterized protein
MYLKIHRTCDGSSVVAICDRELLDRKLRHGETELHVSEHFYGTTPADEAEVSKALSEADNVNIIGERAITIAVNLGLVERSRCLIIEGIPHAQIIRL